MGAGHAQDLASGLFLLRPDHEYRICGHGSVRSAAGQTVRTGSRSAIGRAPFFPACLSAGNTRRYVSNVLPKVVFPASESAIQNEEARVEKRVDLFFPTV